MPQAPDHSSVVVAQFAHIDRRIAVAFGLLLTAVVLVVVLVSGGYLRSIMQRDQDRFFTMTTQVLLDAVGRVSFAGKYQVRIFLENLKKEHADFAYIRLISPEGVVQADSNPQGNDQQLSATELAYLAPVLSDHSTTLVRQVQVQGVPVREVSAAYRWGFDDALQGVIQVGVSEAQTQAALRRLVWLVAALLVLLSGVGIAITRRMSRYFGAPVRELARAMAQESVRLENTLDAVHAGTWEWYVQSKKVVLNERWAQIIGYTLAQLQPINAQTFVRLCHPDDVRHARACITDHLSGRSARYACEVRMQHKDGHWVWVLDSGRLVERDADGNPVKMMGTRQDITERKQQEEHIQHLNAVLEQRVQERTAELEKTLHHLRHTQNELLQNEKLASLGALVAGMSHELNTPIGNAVTVASTLVHNHEKFQTLLGSGLTRSALQAYLGDVLEGAQIIERNLERAAELIGGFKQLAVDQTSYQRRSFALHELAHEITISMCPVLKKTPYQWTVEVPQDIVLDSFPGPLGQVLMNLMNNALLHAFEGRDTGVIALRAQLQAPGWVQVSVSDDGCGIAPESQGKIFDPFFTTKMGQGGSGLGLHIIYTLVTGPLGGRVQLHSVPGEGSCFTLDLPLVAPVPGEGAHLRPETAHAAGDAIR